MKKILEYAYKLVEAVKGVFDSIPDDKKKHIIAGLFIGLVFGELLVLAGIILVVVSVGKELYDFLTDKYLGIKHDVEVLDALATIVGGLAGIGIVHLI
jgi:hypothetical protein